MAGLRHSMHHYAGTDRHIQRMLGTMLLNFDSSRAGVNDILPYSIHFITENKGVMPADFSFKSAQRKTILGLLNSITGNTFIDELLNGFQCGGCIFPIHRLRRTQRALQNFPIGRSWRDTAADNLLNIECIGASKNTAHVQAAAHIVEHNDDWKLLPFTKLLCAEAVELGGGEFAGHGDWGVGTGDWGLETGDWGLGTGD
jgi:hypothetical protein